MFKTFLYFLVRPKWWFRNYSTDDGWSAKLNKLMDENAEVTVSGCFGIKLGDVFVWTANYPYAYGSRMGINDGLPSRKTAVRLNYYINERV